ncbi:MAG: hypothetical protein M0Z99_04765, partial [Betaproteobacteria bacterium]|nr:hypothetical protein [Betaproteobacteria bacterium]
ARYCSGSFSCTLPACVTTMDALLNGTIISSSVAGAAEDMNSTCDAPVSEIAGRPGKVHKAASAARAKRCFIMLDTSHGLVEIGILATLNDRKMTRVFSLDDVFRWRRTQKEIDDLQAMNPSTRRELLRYREDFRGVLPGLRTLSTQIRDEVVSRFTGRAESLLTTNVTPLSTDKRLEWEAQETGQLRYVS